MDRTGGRRYRAASRLAIVATDPAGTVLGSGRPNLVPRYDALGHFTLEKANICGKKEPGPPHRR